MDSDLQDDPSDLIKFDSKINSQVDIILGYRAKRKHNIILKLTTSIYDKLVSFIGISIYLQVQAHL